MTQEIGSAHNEAKLPAYEAPTVTTYREQDILAELGDASATEPFVSLLS